MWLKGILPQAIYITQNCRFHCTTEVRRCVGVSGVNRLDCWGLSVLMDVWWNNQWFLHTEMIYIESSIWKPPPQKKWLFIAFFSWWSMSPEAHNVAWFSPRIYCFLSHCLIQKIERQLPFPALFTCTDRCIEADLTGHHVSLQPGGDAWTCMDMWHDRGSSNLKNGQDSRETGRILHQCSSFQ